MAQLPMKSKAELCLINVRFPPNKSNVRIDPEETQDKPILELCKGERKPIIGMPIPEALLSIELKESQKDAAITQSQALTADDNFLSYYDEALEYAKQAIIEGFKNQEKERRTKHQHGESSGAVLESPNHNSSSNDSSDDQGNKQGTRATNKISLIPSPSVTTTLAEDVSWYWNEPPKIQMTEVLNELVYTEATTMMIAPVLDTIHEEEQVASTPPRLTNLEQKNYDDIIEELIQEIVLNAVKNQLPKLLPNIISDALKKNPVNEPRSKSATIVDPSVSMQIDELDARFESTRSSQGKRIHDGQDDPNNREGEKKKKRRHKDAGKRMNQDRMDEQIHEAQEAQTNEISGMAQFQKDLSKPLPLTGPPGKKRIPVSGSTKAILDLSPIMKSTPSSTSEAFNVSKFLRNSGNYISYTMSKGKSEEGLVANSFDWDDKAFMAIVEDEPFVGKADASSNKKADSSVEELLLTLMNKVKGLKVHNTSPSDNSASVSQTGSIPHEPIECDKKTSSSKKLRVAIQRSSEPTERLKKLVSQLELLGEKLSHEIVNQKLLRSLSLEWNTHAIVWRNKADLDTMSINDLYNNLKVYEPEVKGIQPNSPQLVHEDLEQIYLDDMEEMDLRLQMAMLTIRARRFLKKTGRKLTVNGNKTLGFDMSKVESYNFHKRGQFAKECRSLRYQDNNHKESTRRSVSMETPASIALVSCDECQIVDNCKKGLGYESYNAVSPPYIRNFMPPKHDLFYTGLDEFAVKHVVENKSSKEETKAVRNNTDAPIIEEWVSDDEEENVIQPMIEKKTDKGVIDSGCSRHMTWNISYLADYEEIDREYVAFGGNPKRGKITGK
nr:hypothetical protein [Tanacetum cinerariifolium]